MSYLLLTLSLMTAAAPPPNISAQFSSMNSALRACQGVPGPASVRAALVVYEDGAWSLGLTRWALNSDDPEVKARAVACLDAWERDTLQRQPQLFVHRRPTLYTETLSIPAPAEFVTQVLDGALEQAKIDCRKALRPPVDVPVRARLQLGVDREGKVSARPVEITQHAMSKALFLCVQKELNAVRVASLEAPLVLEREVSVLRRRVRRASSAGNVGEVCAFGGWRQNVRGPDRGVDDHSDDEVEAPAACRPGLSCCGGGAAGSDSHCWAGPVCPALP